MWGFRSISPEGMDKKRSTKFCSCCFQWNTLRIVDRFRRKGVSIFFLFHANDLDDDDDDDDDVDDDDDDDDVGATVANDNEFITT